MYRQIITLGALLVAGPALLAQDRTRPVPTRPTPPPMPMPRPTPPTRPVPPPVVRMPAPPMKKPMPPTKPVPPGSRVTTRPPVKDVARRAPSGRAVLMRPATLPAPKGGAGTVPVSRYASTYGVKLSNGRYGYRGAVHSHWTRKYYYPRRRVWLFFDPCTNGWYFFYAKKEMFLPVSYMSAIEPAPPEDTPPVDAPEVTPQEAPSDISERSAE